jgi:hypothetical protein
VPRNLYAFSENDARILREYLDIIKGRLNNTAGRNDPEDYEGEHQAPEVYIAVAPSGGIPALTIVPGTGPGEYDIPGSAECLLHNIFTDDDEENPEVQPVEEFTQVVYNVYTTAIPAGTTFIAVRDKWGFWLAVPPPGAGTSSDIVYCKLLPEHSTTPIFNNSSQGMFWAELVDYSDLFFDDTIGSNSAITIPETAFYSVTGFISWPASATGIRKLDISIDGVSITADGIMSLPATPSGPTITPFVWESAIDGGSVLRLLAHQNSGGDMYNVAGEIVVRKVN